MGESSTQQIIDQRRAVLVSHMISLYECRTCLGKLIKLSAKRNDETCEAIISTLSVDRVEILTFVDGLEFANHKAILRMQDTFL